LFRELSIMRRLKLKIIRSSVGTCRSCVYTPLRSVGHRHFGVAMHVLFAGFCAPRSVGVACRVGQESDALPRSGLQVLLGKPPPLQQLRERLAPDGILLAVILAPG